MSREQPQEKAFQEFVEQTEKAKSEGTIYTEEFQEQLTKARQQAFSGSSKETTYTYPSKGFHVVQQ